MSQPSSVSKYIPPICIPLHAYKHSLKPPQHYSFIQPIKIILTESDILSIFYLMTLLLPPSPPLTYLLPFPLPLSFPPPPHSRRIAKHYNIVCKEN